MKTFTEPPKFSDLERGWNRFPSSGGFSIGTSKTTVVRVWKIRLGGWAYVYIKSLMKEGVTYAVTPKK